MSKTQAVTPELEAMHAEAVKTLIAESNSVREWLEGQRNTRTIEFDGARALTLALAVAQVVLTREMRDAILGEQP